MFRQMLFDAVVKQNSSFVSQLMKRFQFTEELKDANGDTLIAIASKYGDDKTVQVLISKGFSVNT